MIIFGSVRFLSKKITKQIFFKKNQNQFKPTGFSSIRFFRTKTCLTWFWLGFFCLGLVRFFRFQTYKPKPNRTSWFFQNFNRVNRFFSRFGFFDYFFLFSRFNRFFDFFAHPYFKGGVRSALRSSTQCVAYVGGGVPVELRWIFFLLLSVWVCPNIYCVYLIYCSFFITMCLFFLFNFFICFFNFIIVI